MHDLPERLSSGNFEQIAGALAVLLITGAGFVIRHLMKQINTKDAKIESLMDRALEREKDILNTLNSFEGILTAAVKNQDSIIKSHEHIVEMIGGNNNAQNK